MAVAKDYTDKLLISCQNSIGKQNCKCNHCHIGDFVFETEEEFLIYYDALKDVLEAKDSHRPMQIHCQETGARHFTA